MTRPVLYLSLAALLVGVIPAFSADEMVGPYKLVPALPRPGATQLLDNARGTVWDVIYPPGMSTGMHRHTVDFMGVELVDTMKKLTMPDGKERIAPVMRGRMSFLSKGATHIEEDLAGHPQGNTIIIELKDAAPHLYDNRSGTPGDFGTVGAKQVVDNARVTMWDAHWPQSATASFFQTHDMFLVPIDAGTLSITSPDDAAQTLPLSGGQVVFLQGGHIRTIRTVEGDVRAAVIELK